jgi:hypothetical protein
MDNEGGGGSFELQGAEGDWEHLSSTNFHQQRMQPSPDGTIGRISLAMLEKQTCFLTQLTIGTLGSQSPGYIENQLKYNMQIRQLINVLINQMARTQQLAQN